MPLTWRNINAPDLSGASQMMGQGSQTLMAGLDRLNNLAANHRDTQVANWDQVKQNNTDNYLAQIQGLQDLASQQAMSEQLTPDYFSQYGAQVDKNSILSALSAKPQELMENQMRADAFEDHGADRAARDPLAQITNLINQGQLEAAQQLKESLLAAGTLQPRQTTDASTMLREAADRLRTQSMEDEAHGWKRTEHSMRVQTHNANQLEQALLKQQSELIDEVTSNVTNLMNQGYDFDTVREVSKAAFDEYRIPVKIQNEFFADLRENFDNRNGISPEERKSMDMDWEETTGLAYTRQIRELDGQLDQVNQEMGRIPTLFREITESPTLGEVDNSMWENELGMSRDQFNQRLPGLVEKMAEYLGVKPYEVDPRLIAEAAYRSHHNGTSWYPENYFRRKNTRVLDNVEDIYLREVAAELINTGSKIEQLKADRRMLTETREEVELDARRKQLEHEQSYIGVRRLINQGTHNNR